MMRVEIRRSAEMTIDEFAERNDLVMAVVERNPEDYCAGPSFVGHRYYACFRQAEVKRGAMLCSTFGDGDSPDAAMRAYAREISQRTLVINAYGETRRELNVPRLVER